MQKKSKYIAISFDFGGTLATSNPTPYILLKQVLRELKEKISESEVNEIINKIDKWYAKGHPSNLREERDYCYEIIVKIITKLNLTPSRNVVNAIDGCINPMKLPFSKYRDVDSSLQRLKTKGYKMCVVSNTWPSLNTILLKLDLKHYFDTVVISSKVGYEKPNKRIFEIALKRLRVEPNRMIHIGNEDHDVIGARNAGIIPVLLDRSMSKSANCIKVKSLDEIIQLLEH